MRKVAHALLTAVGTIPWLIAYVCMQLVFWLALLGDKILPDARVGDCWTFVCPRLMKLGGYAGLRPVKRGKFFYLGLIPHVLWVESIPEGTVLLQTEPVNRYTGRLKIWRFFYFSFTLKTTEAGKPRPWRET